MALTEKEINRLIFLGIIYDGHMTKIANASKVKTCTVKIHLINKKWFPYSINEGDRLEENLIPDLIEFSKEDIKSQFFDIINLEEGKNTYGKIIISKNKEYNLKKLSKYEVDLINEIIKKIGSKTARFLTNKTHKEQPYLLTSKNSIISYELAEMLGDRKILDS